MEVLIYLFVRQAGRGCWRGSSAPAPSPAVPQSSRLGCPSAQQITPRGKAQEGPAPAQTWTPEHLRNTRARGTLPGLAANWGTLTCQSRGRSGAGNDQMSTAEMIWENKLHSGWLSVAPFKKHWFLSVIRDLLLIRVEESNFLLIYIWPRVIACQGCGISGQSSISCSHRTHFSLRSKRNMNIHSIKNQAVLSAYVKAHCPASTLLEIPQNQ